MMQHRDQKAETRRRWWQFRLRSLFLMLTLVSILLALLGIPLSEYYREQQIVARIEAAGGRVSRQFVPRLGSSVLSAVVGSRPYMRVTEIEYAALGPGEDFRQLYRLRYLRSLSLSGVPIAQDMLLDIRKIEKLQTLNLAGTGITDPGLSALRGHPNLVRLNVARTPVTDAALEELESQMPHLRKVLRQRAVDELLALNCTIRPSDNPFAGHFDSVHLNRSVAPSDLRHLCQLPGLTELQAMNVVFTGESMKHLGKLTSLRSLRVSHGTIPSGAMKQLRPLTKLRSLRFEWSPVEDEDLIDVSAFRQLTALRLDGSRVTGLGLPHLQPLENLTDLSLDSVQGIYDVDLETLYPLKNLQNLVVPTARISQAGLDRLQEAIPGLQVIGPQPRPFQVSGGPPADSLSAARTAFWSGQYDQLQQCLDAGGGPSNWEQRMWLGHARQLAEDWPGAVAAYKEAIELLNRAISASPDPRQRERLTKEWPTLVLLTGRAQLELLGDTAAAIETLSRGLQFAPAADRSILALAGEAAKRIDGLASPHNTREGTGQLWSDLMYPLTTHRHLALAHENAGDHASALECWTRIRLCKLAYKAAMTEMDALHLAAIWASLDDDKPLPEMPVFSVITGGEPATKLEPESGSSRVTCWDSNAWDSFGLVPLPGFAVTSLNLECVTSNKTIDSKSTLSCWTGAVGRHNVRSSILLDEQIVGSQAEIAQTPVYKVDVTTDHDVLFVSVENLKSVTIHATLRRRIEANEAPKQDPIRPRPVQPEKIVSDTSPFRCVDNLPHEPLDQLYGGASLAQLPDGRFVLASGRDAIEIASSKDGETWDDPVAFPHNTIFPTRSPTLCVDDEGVVWMVYLSKRPSYEIHSSGQYYLYCTSSRDGRDWSQPKPVLPRRMFQYQEVPFLMRDPRGAFRLFLGDQLTTASSPGKFPPTQPLYVPVRADWSPQDVHAVFDDRDRCHIVYTDSMGQVHYSYADGDGIWRVDKRVKEVESMHVQTPQMVLDGDRLALLYWTPKGLWWHRGRMTEDGPRLGPAEPIMNHRFDGQGARLLRIGDDVYLPIPARPPLLLRAKLEDLF
jgi:tetratricopeptide (TPR) repeat protein